MSITKKKKITSNRVKEVAIIEPQRFAMKTHSLARLFFSIKATCFSWSISAVSFANLYVIFPITKIVENEHKKALFNLSWTGLFIDSKVRSRTS